MHPEYTFDMALDTVEGLVIPVYRQGYIPMEHIRAIWGVAYWMKSMVNQLGGEG